MPSLVAHGIPTGDWVALSALLMQQLGQLLSAIAADGVRFPNLHFFDTSVIEIVPAELNTAGASGDWVNEIHLTRSGYKKLALPWAAAIEAVMRA